MAEAIRAPRPASILDRPLLPSWQRIAALSINWELVAFGTIVFIAFVLRIWDVGSRAMHHDESLHAFFAWQLFVGKGYSYDPLMHGPLQFEVVPLFYLLFGDSEFSARLLAVLLGTALVFLPYFLRNYLTRPGALLTATMLAISPAFVYFSRFIRDDIYLACFSLLLFIALIRYLESHRTIYLYLAAASAALALASMEAAYITFFIFGTFLIFQVIREALLKQAGPVLPALRATSLDAWIYAAFIFMLITVLLYSTFFTNAYGIWDPTHAFTSPDRKDLLGGILYWQNQHKFQRGGQPWFYYLLLLPLYEQLALLFGAAGLIYAAIKRTFVNTFLAWWAVLALAIYMWAGEKMPWLTIHIALPLTLLAGLFLGSVLTSRRTRLLVPVAAIFALLLGLELHSTFALNYVDGANPTEMLIYVQTSPDVPRVARSIDQLAKKTGQGTAMPIGLDSQDVGGWPFTWYLRHYTNITETGSFNGPVCAGQYCPVLLMLGPEYDQYKGQLASHYVAQKYRWNWWFPEDYKTWFPNDWNNTTASIRNGRWPVDPLGTASDWSNIWNWTIYRRPFAYRDARWLYFLVRRDLVPGGKQLGPQAGVSTQPLPGVGPVLPARLLFTLGGGSGTGRLEGPRGLAAGNSSYYVADTHAHRVVRFSASGRFLGSWGHPGSGPSEFSLTDSPQGAAVGPSGEVYVADTWNQRIQVFTPDGRFLRQWGGGGIGTAPGHFYGPRSVAVSSAGQVYVADTGNKRIQVFDSRGHYLFAWGSAGTAPGQFQEPSSVVIGRQNRVYVSDFWNRRIQMFTLTGKFLRSWPISGWVAQSYDEPYLAVNPANGNILAPVPQQHLVLEFGPAGRLLGSFGSSALTLPLAVTERANQVAVTDAGVDRVDVFRVRQALKGRTKR